MFCLNLHRDLDPDPRGLEADDLHVVGHVLPVRMVIALAFFKRIFTRSLPMNQAHGLIIGDVYGTCCVSTNTTFWGAGGALFAAALLCALALPTRSPYARARPPADAVAIMPLDS